MISIEDVTKSFGATRVLNHLSLNVEEGEIFVIVGASGSGKTTLLRCLAGLETPDTGRLVVDGRVVFSALPSVVVPPQARGLGMVFQSYALWPHLNVLQNVALPLEEGRQRLPREVIENRARDALRLVEIEDFARRPIAFLSGGQQQRVALARAIAVNPRLILMDEPLSNLDARLREDVRARVRELAKRLGSTVVYVTHDQVEAMAIADRIAVMRSGSVLQVGPPGEVYAHPASREVADFFGRVNWLPAEWRAPGSLRTPVGLMAVERPDAFLPDGQIILGIRPEHLVLGRPPGEPATHRFESEVCGVTNLGGEYLWDLRVGSVRLVARSRARPLPAGATVPVYVDPADVLLFRADASLAGERAASPEQ